MPRAGLLSVFIGTEGQAKMKIAYLLLAHTYPKHLARMITSLSSHDSAFFLHIDEKSNIDKFSPIKGENVFFSNRRIPVYWGEYSMVEAILILIKQALSSVDRYDYFILLSGADYPLRSKEYIQNFLVYNSGMQFISIARVPTPEAGISLSKIRKISVPSRRPVLKFLVKVGARLRLAERDCSRYLGHLQPFGGSTWWALTRSACDYIVDFTQRNQSFCRFFEYTYTPDEMFFHTIIGNSVFRDNVGRSLMYDDWSFGGPHPEMITEQHIALFEAYNKVFLDDAFGAGELLFARKFCDDSAELVERIDKMIQLKDKKQ
jgi:hypothetical protein